MTSGGGIDRKSGGGEKESGEKCLYLEQNGVKWRLEPQNRAACRGGEQPGNQGKPVLRGPFREGEVAASVTDVPGPALPRLCHKPAIPRHAFPGT